MDKEEIKEVLFNRYDVSHETFKRLEDFVSLLQKWSRVHNLVSNSEQNNLWGRHVLDSAQLVSFVSAHNIVLDIGSGSGFPGVILALLSSANIILVERNKKKSVFLSEAKRILCPNLIVKNAPVEETRFDKVDTITARGVAKVSHLLRCSAPYLKQNIKFLLLKGKEWGRELDEAKEQWDFSCQIKDSITDQEGKILILSDIQKKHG